MIGCASVLFFTRTVVKKYRSKSLNLLTVGLACLAIRRFVFGNLGFQTRVFQV